MRGIICGRLTVSKKYRRVQEVQRSKVYTMTFNELVQESINVNYVPKVDKDYINEAIWIGIHNEVQLKALFLVVKMFPPLKIVAKLLLKNYILTSK